jgi:hypothetical protein
MDFRNKLESICPWQTLQAKSNKHPSLLRKSANHCYKKFYNTGPRAQCFKTFYVRNLRVNVISVSDCPWQAYPALSNVCR